MKNRLIAKLAFITASLSLIGCHKQPGSENNFIEAKDLSRQTHEGEHNTWSLINNNHNTKAYKETNKLPAVPFPGAVKSKAHGVPSIDEITVDFQNNIVVFESKKSGINVNSITEIQQHMPWLIQEAIAAHDYLTQKLGFKVSESTRQAIDSYKTSDIATSSLSFSGTEIQSCE